MEQAADCLGKFVVGNVVDLAHHVPCAIATMVHWTSTIRESGQSPADVQASLSHPAFLSVADRYRHKRTFYNFLTDQEEPLRAIHSLLKRDGVLYWQVHAYLAPYARLLGDEVFGEGSCINEVPLRTMASALLRGKFDALDAVDDTILVFNRGNAYPRRTDPLVEGMSLYRDLLLQVSFMGDLIMTVDERNPLAGMTAQAIFEGRRVVAVQQRREVAAGLHRAFSSNKDYPVWLGPTSLFED